MSGVDGAAWAVGGRDDGSGCKEEKERCREKRKRRREEERGEERKKKEKSGKRRTGKKKGVEYKLINKDKFVFLLVKHGIFH
jgi:hypothetical protein